MENFQIRSLTTAATGGYQRYRGGSGRAVVAVLTSAEAFD
jgi:hypothetical protein